MSALTPLEQYHTLPGSDIAIPVMSLGEGLEKLTIDPKGRNSEDPVAKAIRSGKAPTLRDVKMSLKVLSSHIGLRCLHYSYPI
jgi:meiosis-specific protein